MLLISCAHGKSNGPGNELVCEALTEKQVLRIAAEQSINDEASYFAVISNHCGGVSCQLTYIPLNRKDLEWAKSKGYKIYNSQNCFNYNR